MLSHFSRDQLCVTPWTAAHQASLRRDSPGRNTVVGCHFLLQGMKVKRESEVAQSCPTLSDPMDGSPPGSSAHGILQARGLEWVPSPSPTYTTHIHKSHTYTQHTHYTHTSQTTHTKHTYTCVHTDTTHTAHLSLTCLWVILPAQPVVNRRPGTEPQRHSQPERD